VIPSVHIHYRRLPDRVDTYVQALLHDGADVKVTFQPSTPLSGELRVGDRVILEPGSPVVWFTFPGVWHDIGRFHRRDGSFTGIYANILTPPTLHGPADDRLEWHTTDLFLDVWRDATGEVRLLDRDEWARARQDGSLRSDWADRAMDEAQRLMNDEAGGLWPPASVQEWTLERARERLAQSSSTTQAAQRRSTST
jgi:predicted RNA-binding protein associated with RNAse of E/G family